MSKLFFLLLLTGFLLVSVGVALVLIAIALTENGLASGGGVIFIGPFPIVIATGIDASWLVFFSIILTILSIVVFLVVKKKM